MNFLRQIVSGPKNRFRENGYNLDLTYVTNRIIAMAFPASGIQKLYRNSIDDVVQFLKQRHEGSHWIVNISGRSIDQSKLKNTNSYDWEDHCAPPMETLFTICQKMHRYLSQNDKNIVVVHCNQGKGRTGTIICCFLLFCGSFENPRSAMTYYARKRFQIQGMGVTQPCQVRYIQYFYQLMNGPKRSPSVVAVTKVVLIGRSKLSDPYIKIKNVFDNSVILTTKFEPVKYDQSKQMMLVTPKNLVYFCGDVFITLNNDSLIDKKVGRISFNTAFIPKENTITLQIEQISPDSLKKSGIFDPNFKIVIHFKSLCQCQNNTSIENRCKNCLPRLGSQQQRWRNIYKVIQSSSLQQRRSKAQKILFGCQSKVDIQKILHQTTLKQ